MVFEEQTLEEPTHWGRKHSGRCQELGGEAGELVFNSYRDSVLQGESSVHGWWQHNTVNVFNTTELCA